MPRILVYLSLLGLGLLPSCSRYGFEQPVRPCEGITCSDHGECVLVGELAACLCDAGYHSDGLECLPDPEPCLGIDCSGHGRCVVTQDGQAQCACNQGFRNDGALDCVPDPVDCTADADCDDGLFCNGAERCLLDGCSPGVPPDCSYLDGACQVGECRESTAECQPLYLDAATYCDDGLYCNGEDSCDGTGSCRHAGDPCAVSELCIESTDSCETTGGGGTFIQLSAGTRHVCGLAGDGAVYCWGSDSYGQLGNGDQLGDGDRPRPIDTAPLPPGTTFARVACGTDFSCALSHAGAVWCWGRDRDGQLGDSPAESPSQSPVPVALIGSAPIIQLQVGDIFGCALGADGQVQCWGSNLNGQCGDGTFVMRRFTPVRVETSGLPGEQGFVMLSGGATVTCGLTGGGVAYCWGDDLMGQLGNGDPYQDSNVPAAVNTLPITGERFFRHITTGTWVSCGITSQGAVYCWGDDQWGVLGDGPGDSSTTNPVPLDLSRVSGSQSFKQVCNRGGRACGLAADGLVYCWGNDTHGQLGDGGGVLSTFRPGPIDTGPIQGEKAFASLTCGSYMTCGLTAQGAAYCWGLDDLGQLGDGPGDSSSHSPVAVDTAAVTAGDNFVDIQAGVSTSCGLTSRGEIWCWGADDRGQLGDGGTFTDMPTPVPVDTSQIAEETAFVKLAMGYSHACGLTGQGVAYCWGTTEHGALGDGGNTPDNGIPFAVDIGGLPQGIRFVWLAAGNNHTCALSADGAAWCWGFNWYGQVGNGTSGIDSEYNLPQPVTRNVMSEAQTFVHLTVGTDHSCGIAADGLAYCWGYDGSGALGNGDLDSNSTVPDEVDTAGLGGSRTFRQLSAFGYEHTCGVACDGRAYCWGWNDHGEVGINSSNASVQSPALIDTSGVAGSGFMVRFDLGFWFSCGLTAESEAYCWGDDFLGALGNGPLGDTLAPGPVNTSTMTGSTRYRTVSGGSFHSCGIATDGLAYCWGLDSSGQTGTGQAMESYETPQPVAWP